MRETLSLRSKLEALAGVAGCRNPERSEGPVLPPVDTVAYHRKTLTARFFDHVHDRQCDSVLQSELNGFQGNIAAFAKQLYASQCCAHLKARKACSQRGCFAGIENHAADAPSGPVRMNKE